MVRTLTVKGVELFLHNNKWSWSSLIVVNLYMFLGGMLNVLRGEQQLVVEVCWSSQSVVVVVVVLSITLAPHMAHHHLLGVLFLEYIFGPFLFFCLYFFCQREIS